MRLNIAVFTNIYDAHLPHHGGRQNYLAAKANLIKKQIHQLILSTTQSFQNAKRLQSPTTARARGVIWILLDRTKAPEATVR